MRIGQDKMDKPGQHFIVQGQRGSGKTTLLLMIKYTVVDDHLLNSWLIPVIFSEEQYNLPSCISFGKVLRGTSKKKTACMACSTALKMK